MIDAQRITGEHEGGTHRAEGELGCHWCLRRNYIAMEEERHWAGVWQERAQRMGWTPEMSAAEPAPPEHRESRNCWCAPKVEVYEHADVVIHNSKEEGN